MAGWEAAGSQGAPPSYAASSALFAPKQQQQPKGPKLKKAKKAAAAAAVGAGGPGGGGALAAAQVLPLAAQLVGRVLLGAPPGATDAVLQLLLQQARLPDESALRQALLVSIQAAPRAGAAGAAPAPGPLTVLQYQAAVSLMAGMLVQLSAACSAQAPGGSGRSASSGAVGSGKPSQRGAGGGGGGKRAAGEGAAAHGPAAEPTPKKPRPAAAGEGGERSSAVSVNKAPPLICFDCHVGVLLEGGCCRLGPDGGALPAWAAAYAAARAQRAWASPTNALVGCLHTNLVRRG